jgi:hypothetical protein
MSNADILSIRLDKFLTFIQHHKRSFKSNHFQQGCIMHNFLKSKSPWHYPEYHVLRNQNKKNNLFYLTWSAVGVKYTAVRFLINQYPINSTSVTKQCLVRSRFLFYCYNQTNIEKNSLITSVMLLHLSK